ncbi:MAG: Holliday junction branch migration protein RuvA [Clostridiales bacterium]|jgi:Holliday junction DNA helicase RuvA|nr:Holliday junction branch migration protein RuvA [Clostridiales bacterium]
MYEYISGVLSSKNANTAVVDVGGVGYRMLTTQNSLAACHVGENAIFYTHLHVREDIFDLYGFVTVEERAAFEMLLGISGVGPKAALSVLSCMTPSELALAIVCGDSKAITKANGIGVKVASRIVLELKDKISSEMAAMPESEAKSIFAEHTAASDAEAALMVLGYSADAAGRAVKSVGGETTEDIIKNALAIMK